MAEAAPGIKVTEVVSCTLPSVAVMVSVCATVEASVVVNTPWHWWSRRSSRSCCGAAARQRHGRVRNRWPWASSTVTVSVVVEVPSAVTDTGASNQGRGRGRGRTRIEGHRGGLVHAAFGRGDGLVCTNVEASVVVNTPLVGGPGDRSEAVARPATRQRYRRAGNRVAMGILHGHRQRGGRNAVRGHRREVATSVEVVAEAAPGIKVTEVVSCTLPSVAVMVSF